MSAVEQLIFELVASQKMHPTDAAALLAQCQKLTEPIADKEIAIIGMAGKFPKGENLARFWEQLQHQQSCIDEFPDWRIRDCLDERLWGQADKQQWFFKGGYLQRIDQFDPGFFHISPVEAKFMDPMQRLMLETSCQAIEDAGYCYKELNGTNTGVYIGTDHTWGQWYRDNAAEKDPLLCRHPCRWPFPCGRGTDHGNFREYVGDAQPAGQQQNVCATFARSEAKCARGL